MSQATCTWDNTTASRKIIRTKRYNEESWQAGRHMPNTGISSKASLPSTWRDRCTTHVCCQLWHMVHIPGHWPNKHRTNLRPHTPKWKEVCSTSHTKIERPTSGSGRGQKSYIYIIYTVRKMKWSWPPGQGISTASKTTDGPRVSSLGDHMTRKGDKGDQPSGGETTWTNTVATRYGRGQHKTGSFGDDMLRPSPNHGTQWLPNDDDGRVE